MFELSIKTIEKQNIVDEVYDQMKTNIVSGSWKPGDKIPSENQLCQMFNVSRVSVRSAIQKLRAIGIIQTRQGQGSFVSQSINDNMVDNFIPKMNLSEKEILDMSEFRETIEFKCIELAVLRADDEDMLQIENALNKMIANKDDYKKYSEADFEFHLAIAKASKNDILFMVMKNTKDVFYHYLEELNRVLGIHEDSLQGHIEQFQALRNKDSAKVKANIKQGMDENMLKIRERMGL
ncbi:FadR/GntR family transcriptional regulator [Paenibacillus sp. N3.4]|uniref:FadR/GntR family transcriptional regulator n=1 Tax=Paenibacillus sp. N3.4 TaxID=2603222 RepID=UPI0021C3A6BF|nr:FadR/GntR family transcriptional regulator [Paenibacillus sp. N3.4]